MWSTWAAAERPTTARDFSTVAVPLQPIHSSKSISGLHCRILISGVSAKLLDEGSLNGTFVNDVRVHKRR